MGNPTSGCGPDQSPMALPKGGSRHRQSRSISSLPLEKLGRINCEKRASVSAVSSPARVAVLPEPEKQQSIASFLGQDSSTRRKPPHLKSIELATESDKKSTSFNPFRGHRRVGSGSNITSKTTWDYSPRAKLAGTSSSSATASPKKLDKYAVAKIAASLFHSPTKLERSLSLSRGAHRASSTVPHVEKKRNNLTVGEVILPGNHRDVSPFLQPRASQSTEDCMDGRQRTSSHSSAVDMEESAIPPTASSMQNHVIDITKPLEGEEGAQPPTTSIEDPPPITEDITSAIFNSPVLETAAEILHGELYQSPPDAMSSSSSPCMPSTCESAQPRGMSEANMELIPDSPTISIAVLFESTAEEETNVLDNRLTVIVHNPLLQIISEPSDLGDLRPCDCVGDCDSRPSSFPTAIHHVAMKVTREGYAAEDIATQNPTGIQQSHLIATEKLATEEELTEAAVRCSISSEGDDTGPVSITEEDPSREPSPPRDLMMIRVSSTPRTMVYEEPGCKKISVMKPTLRKRRRSVSASGIGAMLLKVVRVPESGTIVTRRFVESLDGVDDAWRARKYGIEKKAVVESVGRTHPPAGPVVCESEPEDAVKSTYSKFVDIEIDPGHGCVELVQNSKDIAHYDGVDNTGWKRHQQAPSPERLLGNSPRHLPPVKINTCTVHEGKTRARKIKTIRRGRMNSYDLDTLKEYLKTTDPFSVLAQADTTTDLPPPPATPPQATMDSNLSTRERSRTFVSRLQAPSSGAFSYVDVYRPCSVSILSNPSFSSSHQDKLWEEQAEIYSSGGRGTPGREDEARGVEAAAQTPPQTLLFNLHHSPSPGFGSTHHHHQGINPSLRRSGLSGGAGMRSPSESGHFMQQIMSKIRGSSPKAAAAGSCPNSQLEISKRRNPWSSCICFSVKS